MWGRFSTDAEAGAWTYRRLEKSPDIRRGNKVFPVPLCVLRGEGLCSKPDLARASRLATSDSTAMFSRFCPYLVAAHR